MPTLQERLAAIRVKREKTAERERQILAQLNRLTRAEQSRMHQILGVGAIAANLVEQCLAHVGEKDREFVRKLRAEEIESATEPTVLPSEPSAEEASGGKPGDPTKLPAKGAADNTAELLADFQAPAKTPQVKVKS